ncbi:MAG: helix-turn-helix transcriptional regulator [Ignavibacteriae bacterium]|nr:helix-turn-helix transcriptional regulator [Saprospiraceae bacterium]MCB0752612.1 helix-turn-helix transcriptional regulator [Ignavibacteriota bacterium]
MTNKEKFLALVSEEDSGTLERNRERIRKRAMLRESQQIALKVLIKLDNLGWSQKDLAKEMGVSPQQITKIVSGKENLTIETQIKIQNILDIPVLASYYEKKAEKLEEMIVSFEERIDKIVAQALFVSNRYESTSASYQQTYNYPLSIAV